MLSFVFVFFGGRFNEILIEEASTGIFSGVHAQVLKLHLEVQRYLDHLFLRHDSTMRRKAFEHVCLSCRQITNPSRVSGRRYVQISATPASTEQQQSLETKTSPSSSPSAGTAMPRQRISRSKDLLESLDARFEVLGSPFSLLSASISASQNLYTRKGTLVGFSGKAENVRVCANV